MIRRIISHIIILNLLVSQTGFAQTLSVPVYTPAVAKVENLRLEHLRGLNFNSVENSFNLVLDKGDFKKESEEYFKPVADKLFEYFLVGVSLQNESFWVNLRPDASDNVIDESLAKTEVGRIMLETDVKLKKELALFTSVRTQEGKEYWDKMYKKAQELYGQEKIAIPTTTRLWIVPDEVFLQEAKGQIYIYKASLKVKLEADYIKTVDTNIQDARKKELNEYSAQIIREIILAKITKRVNLSADFAQLRQVYYSLILAQWFKKVYGNLMDSRFRGNDNKVSSPRKRGSTIKIDSNDLTGLTSKKQWSKEEFFKQYKESYEKKEYSDRRMTMTQDGHTIREYATGGEEFTAIPVSGDNVVIGKINLGKISGTVNLKIDLGEDGSRVVTVVKQEEDDGGRKAITTKAKVDVSQEQGIPFAKYISWRKVGLVEENNFDPNNLPINEIKENDAANIMSLITRQADNIKQSILELVSNASDAQTDEHIGRFGMGALQQLAFVNAGGQVNIESRDSTGQARELIFFKANDEINFTVKLGERTIQGTKNIISVPKELQSFVPEIEEYLQDKLKFFTKMPVYLNGELINPLDEYVYLDGDIVKYQYPDKKIEITINNNEIIIEDFGKGMNEDVMFNKYLIPRLGENSPVPMQQTQQEIAKQVHIFYHSKAKMNNGKCRIVFKVSGVGIQSFEVEGENLPDNLIVELPSSTRLQVSRNEIEIDASTHMAIKILAEKIVNKEPIHQAVLINGFMQAVKLLEKKNKRVDSSKPLLDTAKEIFIPYILQQAKDKNTIFLPNEDIFRQIEIPQDKQVMFLDESLVYGLSLEQIPGAKDLKEGFKPGTFKRAYTVPFKKGAKSFYTMYGPYLLINENLYNKWKKYPILMNLRLNFYIGYGKRHLDKGWILSEKEIVKEQEAAKERIKKIDSEYNLNIDLIVEEYKNLNEVISNRSLSVLEQYAVSNKMKEEEIKEFFAKLDKFVSLVPQNLRLTLDWNKIFKFDKLNKKIMQVSKELIFMPDKKFLELHNQFFANQNSNDRLERYLNNLLTPSNVWDLKLSVEDDKYLHWFLASVDQKALNVIDYEVIENVRKNFENKNLESMEECFKAINEGLKSVSEDGINRLVLRWMRIYNNNPKSAESFYQMMMQEYEREESLDVGKVEMVADPKNVTAKVMQGSYGIDGKISSAIILQHGRYKGKILLAHGVKELSIYDMKADNTVGEKIADIAHGLEWWESIKELPDGRIAIVAGDFLNRRVSILDLRIAGGMSKQFSAFGFAQQIEVLADGNIAVLELSSISIAEVTEKNQIRKKNTIKFERGLERMAFFSDGSYAVVEVTMANKNLKIYTAENSLIYSKPINDLMGGKIEGQEFVIADMHELSPGVVMLSEEQTSQIAIVDYKNGADTVNKFSLEGGQAGEIIKLNPFEFIVLVSSKHFVKLEFGKKNNEENQIKEDLNSVQVKERGILKTDLESSFGGGIVLQNNEDYKGKIVVIDSNGFFHILESQTSDGNRLKEIQLKSPLKVENYSKEMKENKLLELSDGRIIFYFDSCSEISIVDFKKETVEFLDAKLNIPLDIITTYTNINVLKDGKLLIADFDKISLMTIDEEEWVEEKTKQFDGMIDVSTVLSNGMLVTLEIEGDEHYIRVWDIQDVSSPVKKYEKNLSDLDFVDYSILYLHEYSQDILMFLDENKKEALMLNYKTGEVVGRIPLSEGFDYRSRILKVDSRRLLIINNEGTVEEIKLGKKNVGESKSLEEFDYTQLVSLEVKEETLNSPTSVLQFKDGKLADQLLVSSADRGEVISYDLENLSERFGGAIGIMTPGEVLQLSDGRIAIVENEDNSIKIYPNNFYTLNPAVQIIAIPGISYISDLKETSAGVLAISDVNNNQVIVYDIKEGEKFRIPLVRPHKIVVLNNHSICVGDILGDMHIIDLKNPNEKQKIKIEKMTWIYSMSLLSEDLIGVIYQELSSNNHKFKIINLKTEVEIDVLSQEQQEQIKNAKQIIKLNDGRVMIVESENKKRNKVFILNFVQKEKIKQKETLLPKIRSGFKALYEHDDLSGLPALVRMLARFLKEENVDILEEEVVTPRDPAWQTQESLVNKNNSVSLAMVNYIFEKNAKEIKDSEKRFGLESLRRWIKESSNKNFQAYIQIVLSAIEGQDRTERAWIREVGVQNPRDAIRKEIREGRIKQEDAKIEQRSFINNNQWVYSIKDPVGMGVWELMRYYFPLDESSKNHLLDTGNLGQGNYTLYSDFDRAFIRTSKGDGLINEIEIINDPIQGPVIVSWEILKGEYKGSEIRRIKNLDDSDPQLESLFIQEALQKYAGLVSDVGITYNGKSFKEDIEITDRVKLSEDLGEIAIGRSPKKYARHRVVQDEIFVRLPDEKELKFVPDRFIQAYERYGNLHIFIPREILLNIPRNNYAEEQKFLHKLQVAVLYAMMQSVLKDYSERGASIPGMPQDYFMNQGVEDNLQAKKIIRLMSEGEFDKITPEMLNFFVDNPVKFFELISHVPFIAKGYENKITLHQIREKLMEEVLIRKAREEAANLRSVGSIDDVLKNAQEGFSKEFSNSIRDSFLDMQFEAQAKEEDPQPYLDQLPSGALKNFEKLEDKVLAGITSNPPGKGYFYRVNSRKLAVTLGGRLIYWNLFYTLPIIQEIFKLYQDKNLLEEALNQTGGYLWEFFETLVHESQHLLEFEEPGDHTHHDDETIDNGFANRMGKAFDRLLYYISPDDLMDLDKPIPKIDFVQEKPDGGQNGGMGGIDLRVALPVDFNVGANPLAMQSFLLNVDLSVERKQIDMMLQSQLLPAQSRLENYVAGCCLQEKIIVDKQKLVTLFAEYMRVQEQKNLPTENKIKNWVVWLENT